MRVTRFITAIFAMAMLASCCDKIAPTKTYTSVETDSLFERISDRVEEYQTEEDSAYFYALLQCSENGELLLRSINEMSGKNLSLKMELDSVGNLLFKARKNKEKIYISVHDTVIVKEKSVVSDSNEVIVETVEVEKDLGLFEKIYLIVGSIMTWVLVFAIMCLISKIIRRK